MAHAGHRVRAQGTMHGDAVVTIHRRSPPSHVEWSSLSRAWAHGDSSSTPLSPPHARSLLLPYVVTRLPLHTAKQHHQPLLLPSEPPRRIVVSAATSSTRSKLEPTGLDSGTSTSLFTASSPMSSPSPATISAPPALPSLRGGLHNLVACLHPHLCH
jgi:hypothetical protein